MIYLTADQEKVLDVIRGNPRLTYGEISDVTGLDKTAVGHICRRLLQKTMIERIGNKRNFSYSIIEGAEYTISPDGEAPRIVQPQDTLLAELVSTELTNNQRRLLIDNKGLKRSQLARLLGIDKLRLNHFLDQMRVKTN